MSGVTGPATAAGTPATGPAAKTLRTDVGGVRIEGPRDRAGTFAPAVLPKHSRRLAGFDQAVLSLYAKGMTTGDIAAHLADTYGSGGSRELVSKVTDAVVADMNEPAPEIDLVAECLLQVVRRMRGLAIGAVARSADAAGPGGGQS